jgi:hypothetical protein
MDNGAGGGGGGRDSAMVATAPKPIRFSDLGGVEPAMQTIEEAVLFPLRHPEVYAWLGVEPPRGILLHGPPGCVRWEVDRQTVRVECVRRLLRGEGSSLTELRREHANAAGAARRRWRTPSPRRPDVSSSIWPPRRWCRACRGNPRPNCATCSLPPPPPRRPSSLSMRSTPSHPSERRRRCVNPLPQPYLEKMLLTSRVPQSSPGSRAWRGF